MKIGIDCRLWNETGVGRYIRNLVLNLQELDDKNDYSLFALSKNKKEILRQIKNNKFKIIEANIKWHTVSEQFEFPIILNKDNLDLVHFPYFSVPIFYHRPFVVTIHDLIVNYFSTGKASTLPISIYKLKLFAYKYILKEAVKKAIKIVTVSNATKNEIVKNLNVKNEKVIVTYEGVDNNILNFPTSLRFRGASKIKNYFLYVGNAYPHKNLDRLLEALNLLSPDICLVMVGREDPFYKRIKERVNMMGLADRVIFLQNVGDSELSSLYKNAIALVMPSLMEGFGLPVLEAMANKCLVLASDIPSLHEICSEAAVYFDPRDAREIAGRMIEIQSGNSEKKKKGLERVKNFSWKIMAEETLKIYESSVSLR
jgi:glycosyltransferase involved in cell wall biosynthesis